MATTQKKTGSKSGSSRGKRTSSATRGKSTASRGKSTRPAPRPFRREAGAVVCLLLAIFTCFGYFRMQAIFIDFFCSLLKGLIGYGFWVTPPALLLAAYILAFHRGRPVRLRLTCALLLPLVFACLLHGLLVQPLPWDAALVKTLWAQGELLKSGGVLGGILAQGCVTLFTAMGSTIIFAMA